MRKRNGSRNKTKAPFIHFATQRGCGLGFGLVKICSIFQSRYLLFAHIHHVSFKLNTAFCFKAECRFVKKKYSKNIYHLFISRKFLKETYMYAVQCCKLLYRVAKHLWNCIWIWCIPFNQSVWETLTHTTFTSVICCRYLFTINK